MDLWIRSQDRTILTIIKDLRIDIKDSRLDGRYKIQGNLVNEEYYELGVYKNKERALEILDEIEDLIKNLQYMHYAILTNNFSIYNHNVYEMPEK